MSAYMIDRQHIRFLVSAALCFRAKHRAYFTSYYHDGIRHGLDDSQESAGELGQMLWDENRRSIHARYPDTIDNPSNMPGSVGETYMYHSHKPWTGPIDAVQVFKAVHCYEYQACEHAEWDSSQAASFCRALCRAWSTLLPGYEAAEWGAPSAAKRPEGYPADDDFPEAIPGNAWNGPAAEVVATKPAAVAVTVDGDRDRIDMAFADKPEKALRDHLKADGWRWHGKRRVWYHKATPNRVAWARSVASL